jgi:hypothetical protein
MQPIFQSLLQDVVGLNGLATLKKCISTMSESVCMNLRVKLCNNF